MSENERLDSWKEIANYVNVTTKTCQLWEKKLGLPIYRIDNNSKRSRVFTFKSKIDQWFMERTYTKEHILMKQKN